MSISGNAKTYTEIRGSLSLPKAIQGKSAYEIAVINGFDGTEAEWLASLYGGEAVKKQLAELQATVDFLYAKSLIKKAAITLLASAWVGEGDSYSQVVTIEGVTENSKVDLQPSPEQLIIFHEKDVAFVTENEDGIVTVFCIGQKPANDYTIQATIIEVETNG